VRQYTAPEFSAIGSAFTIYTISISLSLCHQLVVNLKVDGGMLMLQQREDV